MRRELRQMKENGIGGFIAESRPHPDYLGRLVGGYEIPCAGGSKSGWGLDVDF